MTLRRYYLLLFINLTSRGVFFAGITANPTGPWTTQAARNLFGRHSDRLDVAKALARDRGPVLRCQKQRCTNEDLD